MSSILNLRIYTPEKLILEEEILKITLNGNEGSFTILPKHVDYISSFSDCIITYIDKNSGVNFLAVNQGVMTKIGRNIEISTFHVILGNSLQELKDRTNEILSKSNELINKEKEINKNLKQMEFTIFKKMLEFKNIC